MRNMFVGCRLCETMADVHIRGTDPNTDITAGGRHPMCSGEFTDSQEL